eukprot:GEMP01055457.1.p1 GENE.GEMP01055457.1~~GEMP01055457.1.p1  ORF type:complete len:172 (+),score=27.86 GEMP01055457.1:24-518(+)
MCEAYCICFLGGKSTPPTTTASVSTVKEVTPKPPKTVKEVTPKPSSTKNGGDCMALQNSASCSGWANQGLCQGTFYPQIKPMCETYCTCFLGGKSTPPTTTTTKQVVPPRCDECRQFCPNRRMLLQSDGSNSVSGFKAVAALGVFMVVIAVSAAVGAKVHDKMQ